MLLLLRFRDTDGSEVEAPRIAVIVMPAMNYYDMRNLQPLLMARGPHGQRAKPLASTPHGQRALPLATTPHGQRAIPLASTPHGQRAIALATTPHGQRALPLATTPQ